MWVEFTSVLLVNKLMLGKLLQPFSEQWITARQLKSGVVVRHPEQPQEVGESALSTGGPARASIVKLTSAVTEEDKEKLITDRLSQNAVPMLCSSAFYFFPCLALTHSAAFVQEAQKATHFFCHSVCSSVWRASEDLVHFRKGKLKGKKKEEKP